MARVMSSQDRTYLPTSGPCFVCGEENAAGLKTRFYIEGGFVKADLNAEPHHCGYPNTVHGGVVAAIMDETMGWAASRVIKRMCYTADLSIRYVRPTPADRTVTVQAHVTRSGSRMVSVASSLVDAEATVYAKGEARFVPLTVEQTLEVDRHLVYRGGEERVFEGIGE
jgi:uncharacterized protein (TIGR00369 family)